MNRSQSSKLATLALRGVVGVCLLVSAISAAHAGDDFGGWHSASVKWLDTPYVDLITLGQIRAREEHGEVNGYLLSQRFELAAHENLALAAAHTWLPFKTATGGWQDQQRVELEANPRITFARNWTVSLRNRIEFRWVEDFFETSNRLRHRPQIARQLHNLGPLRTIYASNEIFYDLDQHDLNQNRLIPFGLGFKLHEKVGLNLYYMIQSVKPGRASSDWNHLHIVGTHWSLAF